MAGEWSYFERMQIARLSVSGREVVNIARGACCTLASNFLFSRECAIALYIKMHWPMSMVVLHLAGCCAAAE